MAMELNELAKELLEQIAEKNNVTIDDAYFGMASIRSHKVKERLGTFVVITEKEYNELCQDHDFVIKLVRAGIKNWDGYENVIKSLKKELE